MPPPAGEAEQECKRTLTNLCDARPTWLELAHKKLDEAVFAAYGWPSNFSDEEILDKLLVLNLERRYNQNKYDKLFLDVLKGQCGTCDRSSFG